MDFLKNVNDAGERLQALIVDKLNSGKSLTMEETLAYQTTEDDEKVLEILSRVADGEIVAGFNINDFLASPSARVLIPKVIIGQARKAADPVYLASAFFKKMAVKSGTIIEFPEFGVIRAFDVAEGQEIPQESLDWQLNTNKQIKVGKSGVRIQYSHELLADAEFDIVGMLSSEAGRAMARHKEQKAYEEFLQYGWTVFDNSQRAAVKEAGTTGLDFQGAFNDTMSIEDYLDLIIAVYNNGFTPTDLIMHPLAWTSFAKNGFTGGLTAPYDRESKRELPNGSFKIGPGSIEGRLPFSFNVNLSPFAPIDKDAKTYDMFVVDRNNVGVQLVRENMRTESFDDPARDITNLKFVERYGMGVYHEGRAVCSAKKISMAKSFPTPERVVQLTSFPA